MRITRDTLLKIVRDTVNQRTRSDRGLMAIYMHGSLLEEDYLLGGATDIDLFFIHTDVIPTAREIVHLSDEVHLDIAHHYHRDYRNTRQLRLHPWLGPTLKDCRILYDPQHFLDFTQASVRGQFDRPDYVLERSRKQLESARQIWLTLHEAHADPAPQDIVGYLRALENAANAVAGIYGPPLTERRFLLRLPERCEAANRPGLYPGLLGMLGAPNVGVETITAWMPLWQSAFKALAAALPSEKIPPRLSPLREVYYQKAFSFLLESSQPQTVLWPLLRSWTLTAASLPASDEHLVDWRSSLEKLNLTGRGFAERVAALDAYLDMVDETQEQWAIANGASAE
jgi:hypothetical protein